MATDISIFHFDSDFFEEKTISHFEELKEKSRPQSGIKWIHINGFQEKDKITEILDILGIDRTSLDNIHDINERPHCDIQPNYSLFYVKLNRLQEIKRLHHTLISEKVYLFFNDKIIVTIHDTTTPIFLGIQRSLREGNRQIRHANAYFLAYILLDTLIDAFVPAIELYADLIDTLEDKAITHPTSKTFETIHGLKKHLIETKKTMWHFAEILRSFTKAPPNTLNDQQQKLFQDSLDHITQYQEIIDGYRDATSGLVDLYFSSQGGKLNEIMKILTIVATIFTPLAYFTGVFGMNFYEESEIWNPIKLNDPWGYIIFFATTLGTTYYMWRLFKRKGWLKSDDVKLPRLMTRSKKK